MFSNDAFDAFSSAINDGDFELMSSTFGSEMAKYFGAMLQEEYGYFRGLYKLLSGAFDANDDSCKD